jgi:hypothetical protein
MKPLRACACALTGLLLTGLAAGCASAGGQVQPATGHLAGKLVMEGGLLEPGGKQPAERPMSGTVTFTSAGRQAVTVKVGSSGEFSVPLPPGRYQVSGRSPGIVEVDGGRSRELPCSLPTSVVVSAGNTATVTLACIVP